MTGAIKKKSDFQVQFTTPENQTSCLGEYIADGIFEELSQPLIFDTEKHNACHNNCLCEKIG